jgi:hypothetical protein
LLKIVKEGKDGWKGFCGHKLYIAHENMHYLFQRGSRNSRNDVAGNTHHRECLYNRIQNECRVTVELPRAVRLKRAAEYARAEADTDMLLRRIRGPKGE